LNPAAFAPLRVSDYRRLWVGQVVSVVGDKINQIAMAIMVYTITGSMFQMGIMLGVTLLPAALFGVVAGVYVDRWDRRRTMLTADLIRAAAVLTIPFVVGFGIWWAYLVAFLASTVALFFVPAKRALIPDIVPAEGLMAANSLDNASEAIAELGGLAVGGALVATLGYQWAFGIDALTFLFSAASIALIAHRSEPATEAVSTESVLSEAVAGLRSIWRSDVLRELTGVYVLAALFASASIALCYALALVRYDAGAPGVAMLDVAITMGILMGAVLVGQGGLKHAGVKFLSGIAGFGLAFGLIALADSIWAAMALLFFVGIANMFFFIPATTLYQTHAEDALRGRVMATTATINRLSMVVGLVGAGALAETTSIPLLAAGVGGAALLVAAFGASRAVLRSA